MPISAIADCSPEHWAEVLAIIKDCAEAEGCDTTLVSEAEETGIIQKRIVQNLYTADIIICDVSGKNPNVMFEMGMRLAFDKPIVIIKDNKTDYSFDTAPIEHLSYPRDLRFNKILEFKVSLRKKLKAGIAGKNSHSFLKSFGEFQTVSFAAKEVPAQEYLVGAIEELKREMHRVSLVVRRAVETSEQSFSPQQAERREMVGLYAKRYLSAPDSATKDRLRARYFERLDQESLDLLQEEMMKQGAFKETEAFIIDRATRAARMSNSESKSKPN